MLETNINYTYIGDAHQPDNTFITSSQFCLTENVCYGKTYI